jgi:pilus assembly protein CpaC
MTSAYTTEQRRLRRATNARPATTAALVVAIIVILVAAPRAQQPAPTFAASAAAPSAAATMTDAPTDVDLLVGRSTVLNIGSTIARVSLTVPDIADAMVTTPTQLLIHGKQPGTISLFVWDRAGAIKTFEVKVRRDLTPLVAHLKQLFPNETISVMGSGKDVVVSGTVTSKYVMEKAAEVAGGYVDKKENVVNLLQQQVGVASNQVMLRVRFAEVSRSALQELGASFFANNARSKWFGRTTTGQFPSPEWDEQGRLVFSDFLNLFVLNTKDGLGAVVRALSNKGLFQSLAEPNLIASNGKEASFLAGGEYPYPIATPSGSGTSFSIMFKEYGVRLNFTPTVLGGDMVHIKVKPEVSALDFANAVTLEGFRIPALTTRRTETEVELQDGQTFAIAGLMNNTLTTQLSKIPGIGDIPILGLLFQSKAHQKNQTELVVMITPQIIKRGQPGVSEGLPSLVEPYLGPPNKSLPNPDAYVGSPRYPVTTKGRAEAPAAKQPPVASGAQPAAAPATLPSRPVSDQPQQPAVSAVPTMPATGTPLPQPAAPAADQQQPAPADAAPANVSQPLTKDQLKALERAREEERKAAARAKAADEKAAEQQRKAEAAAEKQRLEQDKRDAEAKKAADRADEKRRAEEARKAEEMKKQGAQLELERQKREADVARKNADEARRQAEEDEQQQKALSDAEQRLKQAQEAYRAEVARTTVAKGGSK